jgi:hypothetical protein
MKQVAKYNIYKGVSTAMTFGTPIVTLACCGDFFVHSSGTSISAAGVFVILILALFFKDKFLENFKMPPVFIFCGAGLGLILMIEAIMVPIKLVLLTTLIATAVDEFTFKRMYKELELLLPKVVESYKHFGFIFSTTNKLENVNKQYSEQFGKGGDN